MFVSHLDYYFTANTSAAEYSILPPQFLDSDPVNWSFYLWRIFVELTSRSKEMKSDSTVDSESRFL